MNTLQTMAVANAIQWKLAGYIVVFGLTTVTLGACGGDGTVDFRFDNRTPATLCYDLAEEFVTLGECEAKVGAQEVTRWSPECGADQPLTTILTVRESGERIYARTATCSEWNATDREFVIEQRDGKYVVEGPGEN